MRFIHTADWHLGRSLHGVRLLDEQRAVLDQLVALVRDRRPDALLIAGDIYDRAGPPGDAIDLLDDTLCSILDQGVPVMLIAGNHDGPQLISYGSRLFTARSLYSFGKVTSTIPRVTLGDAAGPVHFYALPYAEPLAIRQALGDAAISSHQTAVSAWTARVMAEHPPGERAVALAHVFVAGGGNCESERQLVVGGSAEVDAASFAGFHYVALGHLHRRQCLGDGAIHYSGSPLKYSFSEVEHLKSVNFVELDAAGGCRVEYLPLQPRHDLRCITGYLADVLIRAPDDPQPEDYLSVRLLDQGALLDPLARLREVYPNVLETPRVALAVTTTLRRSRYDYRTADVTALFAEFYEQVVGAPLESEAAAAFAAVIDELRQSEREAC